MADSENINLVRQLANQEGLAHRARMAELKAVTPRNVKGRTLLVNEQPSPVMSLTTYKTPQLAFRNSPQHWTLEAYDMDAPLPPMPSMPARY